ncbi:hypothetical protein M5C72_06350 [Companilactobacillus allii]|uniref:Uncharacterized protein n=1 Tax=Companilactobacillus allii TaxID=1847728 RepID=A0A1P8Q4F4_9LACO|nr:hypothetical protein [Companilactobacillus allii]APX72725.1 hypothetical protein BTM29_09250 [Companilactobacillus allii]USQ67508.1 hypothetical protein M5C72_06350 [Companilactobacillus allii]
MKLTEFFDLIQKIVVKLPAAVKIKKLDGTYSSIKAGTDMQVDLSAVVYSKDQVDDAINKKVVDANTNASITDTALLKQLKDMNTFLNGITE